MGFISGELLSLVIDKTAGNPQNQNLGDSAPEAQHQTENLLYKRAHSRGGDG